MGKQCVLASTLLLVTMATTTLTAATTYQVTATNARLNREVTGEVVAQVFGDDGTAVPAEPVDSFVWDGVGSTPLDEAYFDLEVDPIANTGEISVNWTDANGTWKYKQTAFAPPPHPTGLRVSPDATQTELVVGDPITTNVFLHGNTGAAAPVLPTVFNLLATWGPAEVTLNGQLFNNPFDGPAPLWFGHTMTTAGVRNPDGTVRTTSGDIYVGPNPDGTPLTPADGVTDWDDMEVHFTWHDAPTPMTGNIPPPFSFFYHLVFEDVAFEIAPKKDRRAKLVPELLHPGDCNGDGVLDAADLACVVDVEQRDIVLTMLNTSPGDLDGNGDVSFADFLVLSTNFGQNLPSYTDGTIDLKDAIDFVDFLVLSTNFGNTPTDVAAVPEPSSLALMLLGLTVVGRHISTRRRTETSTRST